MAGVSTANHHVVVSRHNITVPSDQQQYFDLDDAMMMPENLEATLQTVARLVSEMPAVNYATGSCSICMERFWPSDDDSTATTKITCGHIYHRDCITDWLLNASSYSCPLCRHQIFR